MEGIKATIHKLAKHHFEDIVAIRRHLHQNPELSFEEAETAAFVAAQLDDLKIPYQKGVGGHGLVALIGREEDDRPVLALRADMDALPIEETNDVPYKSKRPGVMHACGHDVHTASLLGAARILQALKDRLPGRVKLFFQPAEERIPGGASLMIRDGALNPPTPLVIFGQHVHPPLRAGKVGMCGGRYMASTDELYISIKGKGGHGAIPHQNIDPVLLAAHLVVALQQIVSRRSDPTLPSVLTIGKIRSVGGATNVTPDEVQMEGTFRTMDETWRAEAHRLMQELGQGLVASMGGTCTFRVEKGYPYLTNEESLTQRAYQYAVDYLGEESVEELPIRMTGEDFAYFSQQMPACFYRLGTGNPEKNIISNIHTSTFDIDEEALMVGPGLMAWMAYQELRHLAAKQE